jgi:hypothetical protein
MISNQDRHHLSGFIFVSKVLENASEKKLEIGQSIHEGICIWRFYLGGLKLGGERQYWIFAEQVDSSE